MGILDRERTSHGKTCFVVVIILDEKTINTMAVEVLLFVRDGFIMKTF